MKVHAVATQPQYARHIAGVWRHLPDELRGEFRFDPRATGRRLPADDVVLCASARDTPGVAQRIVFVEHGAGQSYRGDSKAENGKHYPGGLHPDRIIGYVSPRPEVAALWPKPAVVAGCPALDRHNSWLPPSPTAMFTFHFDAARVCPEARSARPHYLRALPKIIERLREQGFGVLGHCHPKDATARTIWAGLGVEFVADPDQALAKCSLILADNTSLMYEAAALDRRVLALNTPLYRRGVDHGLRFWDQIPGWQIDGPDELLDFDFAGYVTDDPSCDLRRTAAGYTYGGVPPAAGGEIAGRWVAELVGHPQHGAP